MVQAESVDSSGMARFRKTRRRSNVLPEDSLHCRNTLQYRDRPNQAFRNCVLPTHLHHLKTYEAGNMAPCRGRYDLVHFFHYGQYLAVHTNSCQLGP